MHYRFLTDADLPVAHTTFLDAFADYYVSMQMSQAQFAAHLAHEGVRLDLSVGAFVGRQMVGLLLNGIDTWQGELTAYDAGTGVIPEYRGQGTAGGMFRFAIPKLRAHGVSRCLLEVIQANEAALTVYRKQGFTVTRSLECVRLDPETAISAPVQRSAIRLERVATPDWTHWQSFWDWRPAWQNSRGTIERSGQEFQFLAAYSERRCAGYVVFSPASGRIAQWGVDRAFRRRGLGSALFAAVREAVDSSRPLSIINIDGEATETLTFLHNMGFFHTISQYEMTLALSRYPT